MSLDCINASVTTPPEYCRAALPPGYKHCRTALPPECKQKQPFPLKMAMINIYNLDKSVCAKHIATECGVSIFHRDKSETARRSAANTRQRKHMAKLYPADPKALNGPPD